MAINDVLPLKAARYDAIANIKCFWGTWDTIAPILMVSFTFTMRRYLIRLASAPVTSSHLANYCVLFAVCNAWQQSRMQNLRMVGKNSGLIFSRLSTKVHEVFRRCRRPFVLSNALDQLPTGISRSVQKIFAINPRSRQPNRCIQFIGTVACFGGMTPTFVRRIISAIYCSLFGKIWLSSVSWSPSAKPGN